MLQPNFDWSYELDDGKKGSVFAHLLRDHETSDTVTMLDSESMALNASDFPLGDVVALVAEFSIQIDGAAENRAVTFVKQSSSFTRSRVINGVWLTDIDIDIDYAASVAAGYPVINIVGSGSGTSASIEYKITTK